METTEQITGLGEERSKRERRKGGENEEERGKRIGVNIAGGEPYRKKRFKRQAKQFPLPVMSE